MRSGVAVLLGETNAGKSTLLNTLVGEKLGIVTPKVQTTRYAMRGIFHHNSTQIVIVDTPGLFNRAQTALEKSMQQSSWAACDGADIALHVIDVTRKNPLPSAPTQQKLKHLDIPKALVFNKTDAFKDKGALLPLAEQANALGIYDDIYMVSATSAKGLEPLKDMLAAKLPEQDWLYPKDQLTDWPEKWLAAEITREKLFLQLHEEVPYALTVEPEAWEHFRNGDIRIAQRIVVERANQKAIVIGKQGSRLKEIGAAARKDLSDTFECKVHLALHVAVREQWQDRLEGVYKDNGT